MGEAAIDQLSLELAAELDANESERTLVDPRTIPTRFSLLKQMALSGAHYFEAAQHPQDDSLAAKLGGLSYAPDKRDALRFGSAVHLMLLGDAEKIALWTGKVRNGGKWDAFQDEQRAKGKTVILNAKEHAHARAVADAILRHKHAMRLLFDDTIVEQRIDWRWLDRDVRSTPDAWRRGKYIADLKTTVSAKPDLFNRHALRFHYHAQAALYVTCVEEHDVSQLDDFYLIAVEKTRPYPVTIFRFSDEAIDVGRRLIRLWMEALLECERSNEWPEYSESVVDLDMPQLGGPFELEIDGKRVEV